MAHIEVSVELNSSLLIDLEIRMYFHVKLGSCSDTFFCGFVFDFLFLPSLVIKGRNVHSSQFLRFVTVPGLSTLKVVKKK